MGSESIDNHAKDGGPGAVCPSYIFAMIFCGAKFLFGKI